MHFRGGKLIDTLASPEKAGVKFAESLLNEKLDWRDLTIQITGVPARMLISAFWFSFFDTMKAEAPPLYPDVENISWVCDHEFQEDLIKSFQTGSVFSQALSG